MVFSSHVFVFYLLPCVVLLHLLAGRWLRNTVLLASSLFFYTWGGGPFVAWLLLSIAGNWLLGMFAARAVLGRDPTRTRAAVTLSVVLNVALLGWFKYANFLVDQLHALGAGFTWTEVLLPIGISFFTFQSMSYVIDIARGHASALRNPLDFALYVALFPQLIAGPIVRYREIAEQIRERTVASEDLTTGALRFALGLCKKVLIADSVAPLADAVFGSGADVGVVDAWVGTFAYGVQIYFDFSGYSDMAIGMGRMFGFRIPENFRRPYAAVSVTDFWRRWHITLSSWFKDYLYLPLGGSRVSTAKTYRNLVVVFLLTGAWHGANWTFVAWGLFHGALLILERLTGWREAPEPGRLPVGRRAYTFVAVMLGWVVFRADSLGDAGSIYGALVGLSGAPAAGVVAEVTWQPLLALLVGMTSPFLSGARALGVTLDEGESLGVSALRYGVAVVALPIALLFVASATFSPFLYFRF